MAPVKQKALLLQSKQGPFVVSDSYDVPRPGPGQLLIKTIATALNPVEWKVQTYGLYVDKYPTVMGVDGAGVVEELGEGVVNFQVGDRVVTQGSFATDHATFQQYFITDAEIAAKIPDSVSFEQAASIPAGLSTAIYGLFHETNPERSAALTPPWEESGKGKYAEQSLLVLGGATSIGQFVIQLGKLSGFNPIIATASFHNAEILQSFGATHVLDRNLSTTALAQEIKNITPNPISIIYDTVALAETQLSAHDLLAPEGTLVLSLPPTDDIAKKTPIKRVVQPFGSPNPPANRELGKRLYSVLPGLLENGAIKASRIEILKDGLAGIPAGLARMKDNQVSGFKLIARPQETP